MICPKCGTSNTNASDTCRRCAAGLHPAAMAAGKSPCFIHANREAITSCGVCGNRLCAACAVNHNGIDYCDACAPANAMRPSFDSDYEKIPVIPLDKAVPASFFLRMRSLLVDFMAFIFLGTLIGLFLWPFTGKFDWVFSPRAGGLPFFELWTALLLAATVYAAIVNSMTGQTFGKQLIGVIVLTPNGHIIDWRTSALRALAAIISAAPLGLGFFWAIWDKDGANMAR